MIEYAADTHLGRVRTGNEDAFIADAALGLFAVADGLGGHQGGEVASRIAAETVAGFVRASSIDTNITWPEGLDPSISFESNQLRSATLLANRRIRQEAERQPEFAGMGSTFVATLLEREKAAFVCVGDSRLYRWRAGALTQLSEDDTWLASMLRAGASPASLQSHGMRHMLTRALGSVPTLDVKVQHTQFDRGDILLLCSDGLYGPIGDQGIARILEASGTSLVAAVAGLIDAANAAGGPDNITAVLVRKDIET